MEDEQLRFIAQINELQREVLHANKIGAITEREFSWYLSKTVDIQKKGVDSTQEIFRLLNEIRDIQKKEVNSDNKHNINKKPNVKRSSHNILNYGLILITAVGFLFSMSKLSSDPDTTAGIGFIGILISIIWWSFSQGRRMGFIFYYPYILISLSLLLFFKGVFGDMGQSDDSMWIYSVIIGFFFLVLLAEYFTRPKCPNCKKRLGMKKVAESDVVNYDYIGTKTYGVYSKGGERVGSYEGPVSKTLTNFTAHYKCLYCNESLARQESEDYEN